MRATVGQKRGKWGLRIYSGNREKWRTIGEGDEALEKARKLAEAANTREDRRRQSRKAPSDIERRQLRSTSGRSRTRSPSRQPKASTQAGPK